MTFLVGEDRASCERVFDAVCAWNRELRAEVLVFDRGYWDKSQALYEQVRKAKLDELVLAGDLRERIVGDLERFLARRADYERLGVPWKRGILLSGPPGNGKTMCVKSLANHLQVDGQPIDLLYVRSLVSHHMPDHYTIGEVFERARHQTPCLLVFEDLDSIVTDENRSVLLNELDGLAVNDGIITIASTNHPDRLDPALVERPSRFDRTWHFELPAEPERRRYLISWSRRLVDETRLEDEHLGRVAGMTDGFSFAYLQELMVSSLMRWMGEPDETPLADVVVSQVDELRKQMRSAAAAAEAARKKAEEAKEAQEQTDPDVS